MADKISMNRRSWNMSRIKGKNTKPELRVRSFLHKSGFRFRIHRKDLPGNPDIVLPKYKTVIFVNGCFWHMHENCKECTIPKTNTDFWLAKLNSNLERDRLNYTKLLALGWRIIVIWECEIKNFEKVENKIKEELLK